MKKAVDKAKAEKYIVIFIIIAAVLFSLSQTIIYYINTPSGFSFQFAHNFIEDYYYYLHIMRQGWEGHWLATSLLTPEVYPPMFVVPFFLFLGHLARIFNLSLPIVYTLARAIGGIGLIGLTWVLVKAVYPESLNKRLLALIFVCFGTSWWTLNNGQTSPTSLVRDWTELDPIFRLTFISHHLWSKVFMILSFIYIIILIQSYFRFHTPGEPKSKTVTPGVSKAYLRLTLAILFMGFTNPVAISTFLPVVGLWMGLELAVKFLHPGGVLRDVKRLFAHRPGCLKAFFPFIIALIVGLSVALYHRFVQNTVFPWTSYLSWEKVQYHISFVSYLSSLGPLFVLFLIGIPGLFKRQFIGSLLIAWTAAGWILLFLIGPLLPLTNSRYLGGYQFIPIGIGAVAGIEILQKLITSCCLWLIKDQRSKIKDQKHSAKFKIDQIYQGIFIICLFVYFAVGLSASWRQQIYYVKINQNNQQVYLPDELLAAFKFLDGQKPAGTVILAPYNVSTMIPAFTGSRVVAGHAMMTQNFSRKKKAIEEFYTYPMKDTAEHILKLHNVSYILLPKGNMPSLTYLSALHLAPVYENEVWEVVKVDK